MCILTVLLLELSGNKSKFVDCSSKLNVFIAFIFAVSVPLNLASEL